MPQRGSPFPGPDHSRDAGLYSPTPAASGHGSFEAPPSSPLPPWRHQLVADSRNVLDRSCGFGADQPETPHDRLQASIVLLPISAASARPLITTFRSARRDI